MSIRPISIIKVLLTFFRQELSWFSLALIALQLLFQDAFLLHLHSTLPFIYARQFCPASCPAQ